MRKELQQLQTQTLAGKTLAEVKELVWTDISKSINEIWPMVQIRFEQNELLERRKQVVEKIRTELGDMPTQANEIIRFLNSKTREELEELKIEDRTDEDSGGHHFKCYPHSRIEHSDSDSSTIRNYREGTRRHHRPGQVYGENEFARV